LLPDELLALVKTLSLAPEQLLHQASRDKPLKLTLAASEARLLVETIQKRLGQYPTSVEQDEEILRHLQLSDGSNRRQEMALKVRMGEKEILRQLSVMLSEYTEQHGAKATTAKRHADGIADGDVRNSKTQKSS
jgi:SET domain-containing protein 6